MSISTQRDVRDLFEYLPGSGQLVWRPRPLHHFKDASYQSRWNDKFVGKSAGSLSGSVRYLRITFAGRTYLAHRLIWLHVYGVWPNGEIDHINGDRTDNRLANLRLVDHCANARNAALPSHNTSGVIGVSYDARDDLWHAYIGIGAGSRKSLGYFKTKSEACAARQAGERLLGYHPNHGRAA